MIEITYPGEPWSFAQCRDNTLHPRHGRFAQGAALG